MIRGTNKRTLKLFTSVTEVEEKNFKLSHFIKFVSRENLTYKMQEGKFA